MRTPFSVQGNLKPMQLRTSDSPPPLGSKDVADMVLVLDDTDAGQGWLAIPIGLTRKSRNSCAVPVTLYVSHTNLLSFLFLSFFAIASLPNP